MWRLRSPYLSHIFPFSVSGGLCCLIFAFLGIFTIFFIRLRRCEGWSVASLVAHIASRGRLHCLPHVSFHGNIIHLDASQESKSIEYQCHTLIAV